MSFFNSQDQMILLFDEFPKLTRQAEPFLSKTAMIIISQARFSPKAFLEQLRLIANEEAMWKLTCRRLKMQNRSKVTIKISRRTYTGTKSMKIVLISSGKPGVPGGAGKIQITRTSSPGNALTFEDQTKRLTL